jgi:hypothetical protein
MFDFGKMFSNPQAREMMFSMMTQQMAQVPPDIREALGRVEVGIRKTERGFDLRIGRSDDPRVEEMITNALNSWSDLLSRGFNAMGYKVVMYE